MTVLRDRAIAALLAAEVVSSLGTQMTWIALPWFVLRTTGSPQRMTWVIIAELLPIRSRDVLAKIQSGDSSWENLVPGPIVEVIKREGLFGYRECSQPCPTAVG